MTTPRRKEGGADRKRAIKYKQKCVKGDNSNEEEGIEKSKARNRRKSKSSGN